MSEQSYMQSLLDDVELDWRSLGDQDFFEIANTARRPIKASLRSAGGTPYYGANNIQDYVEGHTHDGEFVLIAEDGSASLENYSIQYVKGGFWANNHVHVVRGKEDIATRFLFHYLKIVNFLPFLSGGGRAKLTKGKLIEIQIPIPPLRVQKEIIRILDAFTELTNELTNELANELTNRKKQYNHYRDQLFSFEEVEVEWKTLGEIGEFIRGRRFTKADYVDDGIHVIHYGEIYTHYGVSTNHAVSQVRPDLADSLRYAQPGDVVIAGVGETVEEVGKAVAWLGDGRVAIHDDSYALRHDINAKYISYYLQTAKFNTDKVPHVSLGKMKRLLIDGISKVRIPIPYPSEPERSLEEQSRIVAILDEFDALTNSISAGLPREIELRQKQYTYYRDMLLRFPKPESME